jgi:hypothetical protein
MDSPTLPKRWSVLDGGVSLNDKVFGSGSGQQTPSPCQQWYQVLTNRENLCSEEPQMGHSQASISGRMGEHTALRVHNRRQYSKRMKALQPQTTPQTAWRERSQKKRTTHCTMWSIYTTTEQATPCCESEVSLDQQEQHRGTK